MDYEQKYKEALERAKEINNEHKAQPFDIMLKVFPELKSEDERIRKEIISALKYANHKGVYDKHIAWLEKQGEKETSCDRCRKAQPSHSCQDITELGRCYLEHEKQSEQKVSVADFKAKDWYVSKVDGKIHNIHHSVDKVEPKFKVGDFIVNDYCMGKVIELTDDAYLLDTEQGIPFSCEHNAHLWTIEDANDGDVLSNGKMIVIFKHFEEPSYRQHIVAYVGLDSCGDIQITDDTWCLGIDKAKPATKEQRDTLERAITNAGYRWDKENLKLEKI